MLPVTYGVNIVRINSLDTPTVLQQPNGDTRPLLLGIRDPQVEFIRNNDH